MSCPKCGADMSSNRSDNMIVNACPKCLYSECYISETEVDNIFNRVFEKMSATREAAKDEH